MDGLSLFGFALLVCQDQGLFHVAIVPSLALSGNIVARPRSIVRKTPERAARSVLACTEGLTSPTTFANHRCRTCAAALSRPVGAFGRKCRGALARFAGSMFSSGFEPAEECLMPFGKRIAFLALGVVIVTGLDSFRRTSADDAPPPRKLAFLVGVKTYEHADLKDLDFSENDVQELADVLKRQGFAVTLMSTAAQRTDKVHYPDADNIRTQLSATLKVRVEAGLNSRRPGRSRFATAQRHPELLLPHDANPSERNGDVAHPENLAVDRGNLDANSRQRHRPEVAAGRRLSQ